MHYPIRSQLGLLTVVFLSITPPTLSYLIELEPSTGQPVLTTLAVIQASIFAIVFSVVILAVQLSTSEYSPRLVNLFRSDDSYKRTISLFGISIGLNVSILLLYGEINGFWPELLTFYSASLAVVAFVSLFGFVDQTLKNTTPEGILQRLKDRLEASQIIDQAERAADEPTEPDPYLTPLSVINSTIMERDAAAAYLGLSIVSQQTEKLLDEISEEQIEEETPLGEVLHELCTNRLPNSVENAVDSGTEETAEEVISTLAEIGESAISRHLVRPVILVVRGISEVIGALGYDSISERTRTEAIDKAKETVIYSADNDRMWESAGKGTRFLGWQAANSVLARDESEGRDLRYSSLTILCFPKVLAKLVEAHSEAIDSDVNWESPQPGHTFNSYSKAKAIRDTYVAMAELTMSFIRYEQRFGTTLVDWETVGHGWTSPLSALSQSELESFQQLWVGSILYLEYVQTETPEEVMNRFSPVLIRDVSNSFIISTIDAILDSDIDPSKKFNFRQTVDPLDIPSTGYPVQILSNPDRTFEEWLEQRRQAHDRRPF